MAVNLKTIPMENMNKWMNLWTIIITSIIKSQYWNFFFNYFRQKNNTDLRHTKANKMTEYSKLIFQRLGWKKE